MRVIAGERKGLRLLAPHGRRLRPTADRVKQVLFDLLQNEVAGQRVVDLFAGSGALGIEALSRGAREAIFVERDLQALAVLRRNLELARYGARARIMAQRVELFLRRWPETEGVDVVLADPPYGEMAGRLLRWLDRFDALKVGGLAAIEHSSRDELDVELKRLLRMDRRIIGDSAISIFRREDG